MAALAVLIDEQTTARIKAIEQFLSELNAADMQSDAKFQEFIRDGQKLLEMPDQQIADAIRVSRPTVNRWMSGTNLPHVLARQTIAGWMKRELAQKIKLLR